jgi:hypothetical protein
VIHILPHLRFPLPRVEHMGTVWWFTGRVGTWDCETHETPVAEYSCEVYFRTGWFDYDGQFVEMNTKE